MTVVIIRPPIAVLSWQRGANLRLMRSFYSLAHIALILLTILAAAPAHSQTHKLDLIGFSTGKAFRETVDFAYANRWRCRSNSVRKPAPSGCKCSGNEMDLILEFAEKRTDQPLASITIFFPARESEMEVSTRIGQVYATEASEIRSADGLVSKYIWNLSDHVTLTLRPPRKLSEDYSLTLLDTVLVLEIQEPIGIIDE